MHHRLALQPCWRIRTILWAVSSLWVTSFLSLLSQRDDHMDSRGHIIMWVHLGVGGLCSFWMFYCWYLKSCHVGFLLFFKDVQGFLLRDAQLFCPSCSKFTHLSKLARMRASGKAYGGWGEKPKWEHGVPVSCWSAFHTIRTSSVESQVQERLGRGWTGRGGWWEGPSRVSQRHSAEPTRKKELT